MITVVNLYKKPYDVYIGRSGRKQNGKWGNPFSEGTREENIAKFEEYLVNNKELMQDLHELKDKRLGCFCAPKPCHGDILKKYAESLTKRILDSKLYKPIDHTDACECMYCQQLT